jgi:hypothetical protein
MVTKGFSRVDTMGTSRWPRLISKSTTVTRRWVLMSTMSATRLAGLARKSTMNTIPLRGLVPLNTMVATRARPRPGWRQSQVRAARLP